MYPIIFSYKFITIASYGVMLGLGFYLAFMLLERELKLVNKDPELAYKILLVAIPCGIIGAKIFHILEHFDLFLNNPMGMIFSGSGLSVYGGFVLSLIVSVFVIRKANENVLEIFDLASAPMALGYGLGRMGCHVSGDGCYGLRTLSFLGTPYPNGIVPTSSEVFPTPLFESFFSLFLVVLLLQLRKKEMSHGRVFFTYLILNGIARFSVEFIRLNPKIAFGLSNAQFTAIGFVLTGALGLLYVSKTAKNNAA